MRHAGRQILNADWATAGTDIPAHVHAINAAMIRLTGMGLAHIILTSAGWQKVANNTKVKDQGGVSNKALYLAIGVNCAGLKEVLRMWASETEGAKFWLGIITELKNEE